MANIRTLTQDQASMDYIEVGSATISKPGSKLGTINADKAIQQHQLKQAVQGGAGSQVMISQAFEMQRDGKVKGKKQKKNQMYQKGGWKVNQK